MRWEESLSIQVKSLSHLLTLQYLEEQVDHVVKFLREIKGFIFFTGVGKNMYTAARVSDTFQSLGMRSLFVDPVNSLHGGMGVFSDEDIIVAISKSGETDELLRFLEILVTRNLNNIIAITSNPSSRLSKMARYALVIPVEEEGDHLNMAPISSTMVFGAILDSIAVQISSERNYSRKDFVFNHPGGSLGKSKL